MAHPEQAEFVGGLKSRFPEFFKNVSVLEVGSWNCNGTIRDFFEQCPDYVGIDLMKGPCVDFVANGSTFSSDKPFDVVASCEAFEHDRGWRATFANMYKLCRPGGLIFMTCASPGRQEHGTFSHHPLTSPATNDFYSNVSYDDMMAEICKYEWETYQLYDLRSSCDLQFHGKKK